MTNPPLLFVDKDLNIYGTIEEPLFKLSDVNKLVDNESLRGLVKLFANDLTKKINGEVYFNEGGLTACWKFARASTRETIAVRITAILKALRSPHRPGQ